MEVLRNVVRVALYLMEENAPPVIYAGNTQLREAVTKLMGTNVSLRPADNVRPMPDVENVGPAGEEMEVLFFEQKMQELPGIRVLNSWSPSVVLPTARAVDYAIRCSEQVWQSSKAALGIDVGSAHVSINVCEAGQPLTTIRGDLGIGHGLSKLLEKVEVRDLVRWLPFKISESQVRDRLMNKFLHSHSVPQTREDLLLEQAVAREAIRLALQDALPGWPGRSVVRRQEDVLPPCEPIIATGGVFAHSPYQGYAALMLLDALQPAGITGLYLDEYNLIPSLGAVAAVEPLAAVQTIRNGGLTFLGTAVIPRGQGQPGERALTIRPVDRESSIRSDVKYGDLEAIPFEFFKPGTMLELVPAHAFDIGAGLGKAVKIEYKGGTVGLIIDARGRPLRFDDDPEVQRQRVDNWLWEMMSA
jgi:hypothetical protein